MKEKIKNFLFVLGCTSLALDLFTILWMNIQRSIEKKKKEEDIYYQKLERVMEREEKIRKAKERAGYI